MFCPKCRKPMLSGDFIIEEQYGTHHSYPVASWHRNGIKYCETPQSKTLGFYCSDCGLMTGIFQYTKPVNFIGKFDTDIDDSIDVLPVKKCPVCSTEMDIDYPRCFNCGYIYESI